LTGQVERIVKQLSNLVDTTLKANSIFKVLGDTNANKQDKKYQEMNQLFVNLQALESKLA